METGPRWRVAILDDHERSRAALRGAIWAAGGEVVGEALRCTDALPLITRASPDAAIFAVGLPDGDGIEAAAHVIATADCPVVLFTSHTGDDVIERAKGSLMARFGLTEDEAFRRLRRAAMDNRKPMVEIARALLVSESVARG